MTKIRDKRRTWMVSELVTPTPTQRATGVQPRGLGTATVYRSNPPAGSVLVRALYAVMGLYRGQEAWVKQTIQVDHAVRIRMLTLLDSASGTDPTPSYVVAVEHGADAGMVRPVGVVSVFWVGTVEPLNADDLHDVWLDVTGQG